jgi:methyl-accepting chemotaxis protein
MLKKLNVLPIKYRMFLSILIIPLFVVLINIFVTIPNAKADREEALQLRAIDQITAIKTSVNGLFNKYGYNEETIEIAKEVIRTTRYGEGNIDYLFSGTTENKMLVHPIRPELDGLDITNLKSADGKLIGQDVIKIGREGGGFYKYQWAYPGSEEIGNKIAYIEMINEELGWVLGAGMYTDSIDVYIKTLYIFAGTLMIIIFLFAVIIGLISVREIKKIINNFTDNMQKAILGDLKIRYSLEIFDKYIPVKALEKVKSNDNICFFEIGTEDGDCSCPALDNIKSCIECKYYQRVNSNEFAHLGAWFNKFLVDINNIFKTANNNATDVFNSSFELSGVADTISSNAQENAAVFEEITSTIEEISAGISNVSDFANTQNDVIKELDNNLKKINEIVNKAGLSMNNAVISKDKVLSSLDKTNKIVGDTKTSIIKLNEDMERIKSISEVISDIADQVKLLSLNASIEAARAGEHGKGFSVVADEIGKLSVSTSDEAKAINDLIKVIEKSMRQTVEYVSSSIKEINDSIGNINYFSDRINEVAVLAKEDLNTQEIIKEQSKTVLENSEKITHATVEHSMAIEDISKSIANVNDLAQSYASSAEELSANSETLNNKSQSLIDMIKRYKI